MNDFAAHLEGIRDRPTGVLGVLFDRAPTPVCAIRDGRLVYLNDAAGRLWAAPTIETMLGRPVRDCFVRTRLLEAQPVVGGTPATLVVRRCDAGMVEVGATVLRPDPALGADLHLLVLGGDAEGAVAQFERTEPHTLRSLPAADVSPLPGGTDPGRPISAGPLARRVTESLGRLAEMVVAGLDEGIVIVDRRARILWANPAATRITGLRPGDSMRALDLRTEDDAEVFPNVLPVDPRPGEVRAGGPPVGNGADDEGLVDDLPAELLCRLDRGDGIATWLSVACAPLRDGADGHAVVSIVDISERQLVAEKLLYAAGHDELTGLPGRSLLIERIGTALAGRAAGRLGALMFIDLDRLKLVNDTHGHLAGDEVLRVFAQRLRGNLRRDDVIGRLGGDEFVVLVLGCRRARDVVSIADRLQRQLDESMVISLDDGDGEEPIVVSVGASIGIVTIDDDDQRSPRRLLAEADSAMYRVKRAGRGHIAPGQPLSR